MPVATKSRGLNGGSLPIRNRHSEFDDRDAPEPPVFSLARILLVATLFGAPLAFGAVVPWAWGALGLLACLELIMWAFGSVQRGSLRLIWSPLYIPLALFLLLGVVQYTAGLTLEGPETRQALVLLAVDLAFFFLALHLFAGAGSQALPAFGLAVLVYGGLLGLFTILQFVSGTHRIYGIVDTPRDALFGPYVNRDHYAGLMEMLIPVAILSVAGRRTRGSWGAKALCVFAVTLTVASLLLSGSRAGLLALSAEIAVAAIVLRGTVAQTKGGRRLALSAAGVLAAGVILFAYLDPGGIARRLGSVADVNAARAEWDGRRKLMAFDTLRMWRDHPGLGVGMGAFEIAYPHYQSFPSDDWIDHAHNDYIEALAETGLVGALLILWALALFLREAFRDWEQSSRPQASWIRLAAAIGCFGILVHSLWDFNLHIPANAAWFAVLAGITTTSPDSSAIDDQY